MKLKQILFGGLFAALMASCSNDLPMPDDGKVLENETTTYVRLSLVGEGVTRADAAYENGSADENEVKRILLVFFDGGRNYVGKTLMNIGDNATISTEGTSGTVEKLLTVVAQVKLPENINYPKFVVALVNPTSASGDLAVDKIENMMRMLRERSEVSHDGYRSMNNSVYYNEASAYVKFATEVDFQKQFFSTMEEAKEAEDATIEITVERLEAKVRLNLEKPLSSITPAPYSAASLEGSAAKYTLEFVPEAWFVNGTEKRTFLLKNYRSTRENYTEHMPFDDLGMRFGAFRAAFASDRADLVNDEPNLRSYWAIDPTYFIETTDAHNLYPDVSYDVLYKPANFSGITVNPAGQTYPLNYRSYTDVLKEKEKHESSHYIKYNESVKLHEYVLENTLSQLTLTSTNAKAAMASVVLLGHYVVKNAAGEVVFDGTTDDKSKSFYVRHEAESNRIVMISDNEAIDFFLERGGNIFCVKSRDAAGNVIEGEFEPLRAAHLSSDIDYGVSYDDFELVYPNSTYAGANILSEQWRTLQLKKKGDKYNENLYIYEASYNDNKGGYRPITTQDVEGGSLKTNMYSTYGVLEKFQTGKAYFNVPLKHIWGLGSSSNAFDPKTVKLGDYGVVRNHIYDLTINKIEGLGTGIGEIDQPIVPPTENENYYINTRLRILKWRLVNQSVDL